VPHVSYSFPNLLTHRDFRVVVVPVSSQHPAAAPKLRGIRPLFCRPKSATRLAYVGKAATVQAPHSRGQVSQFPGAGDVEMQTGPLKMCSPVIQGPMRSAGHLSRESSTLLRRQSQLPGRPSGAGKFPSAFLSPPQAKTMMPEVADSLYGQLRWWSGSGRPAVGARGKATHWYILAGDGGGLLAPQSISLHWDTTLGAAQL